MTHVVHLINKQDFLSSGKSKTGYHTLKDDYLIKLDSIEGEKKYNFVPVDYVELLDAFKTTDNAMDFLRKVAPNLPL